MTGKGGVAAASWGPRDCAGAGAAHEGLDPLKTTFTALRAPARILAGEPLEELLPRLRRLTRFGCRRRRVQKLSAESESLALDPVRQEAVAADSDEAAR